MLPWLEPFLILNLSYVVRSLYIPVITYSLLTLRNKHREAFSSIFQNCSVSSFSLVASPSAASASKTAITLVGFKHHLLCCGSDYLISTLQVRACVLSSRILSSTFSCQLLNYRKLSGKHPDEMISQLIW